MSDLNHRFRYHPARDDKTREEHEFVRAVLRVAAEELDCRVPDGREKSLMMTKLEEAMMWGNAGVARNQDRL